MQAASGVIVSMWVSSRSGPSIQIRISSPRAAKICSFSSRYRGFGDMACMPTSLSCSVGRMPIMTRWLPAWRARPSACARLARTRRSSPARASPDSGWGGTLISRLNWPSSLAQWESAMAPSTSLFFIEGRPSSSTRLTSISSPTCRGSMSNLDSRSIRANTSRQHRTFLR